MCFIVNVDSFDNISALLSEDVMMPTLHVSDKHLCMSHTVATVTCLLIIFACSPSPIPKCSEMSLFELNLSPKPTEKS